MKEDKTASPQLAARIITLIPTPALTGSGSAGYYNSKEELQSLSRKAPRELLPMSIFICAMLCHK